MDDLMSTLHQASAHFVRCVKPNDVKQPCFEPKRVLQQVRGTEVGDASRDETGTDGKLSIILIIGF